MQRKVATERASAGKTSDGLHERSATADRQNTQKISEFLAGKPVVVLPTITH
jgi:hypothetical protein